VTITPAIKAPKPKDGMAARPATSGGMYLKGTSVVSELQAKFTTSTGKPEKTHAVVSKSNTAPSWYEHRRMHQICQLRSRECRIEGPICD